MAKTETKKLALTLFLNSEHTQKDIADIVKVTPRTLSKWCKEGGWEQLKESYSLSRERAVADILAQINELNSTIKLRPEGSRFASSKEADVLSKLTKHVYYLDGSLKLKDYYTVFTEVVNFISRHDLEFAKRLSDYHYEYLLKISGNE